jgi:hypothetical protein
MPHCLHRSISRLAATSSFFQAFLIAAPTPTNINNTFANANLSQR